MQAQRYEPYGHVLYGHMMCVWIVWAHVSHWQVAQSHLPDAHVLYAAHAQQRHAPYEHVELFG